MDNRDRLIVIFSFPRSEDSFETGVEAWIDLIGKLQTLDPHFANVVSPMTAADGEGITGLPFDAADFLARKQALRQEAMRDAMEQEGEEAEMIGLPNVVTGISRATTAGAERWVTDITYRWNGAWDVDQLSLSIRLPFLQPPPDVSLIKSLLALVANWRELTHMIAAGNSTLGDIRVFDDKQTVGWASWWPRPIPPEALRRAHLATPMLGGTFVASTPGPFDYTQEPQVRAMQDLDVDLNEAGVLQPLEDIPLIP